MGDSEGAVSAVEDQFDRWRRRVGLVLAPVVFGVLWFVPVEGMSGEAHRLLSVFGLVIWLWLTEAIPLAVTALMGPALCVVFGVCSEKEAFRGFGNPILFLFMGSFMLAQAMMHHGLNHRIAMVILRLPWVGRSPGRIVAAFALIVCGLSMWISNTSATAMMFPVAMAILSEMARRRSEQLGRPVAVADLRYGIGLMLATAFAASIGGMATPVGSPPNLIGLGLIEQGVGAKIGFFQWMAFGVPLSLALAGFLIVYLNWTCPAEGGLLGGVLQGVVTEVKEPLSRGAKNVLLAFGATVVLWLMPGIITATVGASSPAAAWLSGHVPESVAALVGAALLFVLPVDWRRGEFTLSWREARRIEWGTILFFGGGLSMGEMMFSTGLAKWMGEGIASALPAHTELGLVAVFAVVGLALTEVTSNTAAAAMVVPIAIAVAQAAGVDPMPCALAATLSASLAFMLPISTPPNAIVYGSGCVPILKMVRHGVVLDAVAVVLVVAVVHWAVPLVLG
ncbi:MAG TPA: DASS family sodium-coupled anion symporter [Verrucomicrobiae bacterium]|nr:DASS family sodium-coupled anion symporter [Verrucomicrobiae bacterium]